MEIMNNPRIQRALNFRHFSWSFITPGAPWKNGFTERMIGTVKIFLRKTLHKAKLATEELRTVIVEIKANVNN